MATLMDHLISWMIAVPIFRNCHACVCSRSRMDPDGLPFGSTMVELGMVIILCIRILISHSRVCNLSNAMAWMPTFNIHYAVGVDGISILMVTAHGTSYAPSAVLCSWISGITTTSTRIYVADLVGSGCHDRGVYRTRPLSSFSCCGNSP